MKRLSSSWIFGLILSVSSVFLALDSSAQSVDLNYAQPKVDYDTNYIKTFPEHINVRLYFSRKFTSINFEEQGENTLIDYQPNTTLNFGIGATAKGFTLNLAYGFAFLNQDESRGKTSYLDLQSHIYGRKFAADFFGQIYSGMYLNNTSNFFPDYPVNHYLRPDINIVALGGSFFWVFNHEKFSYSASMVQNEWQKKSAGSFLLGGKIMLVAAGADSSLIPSFPSDSIFNAFKGVTNLATFQFGPGLGYTHTFVIKQHFFITLSLDMNIMISAIGYQGTNVQQENEWQVNPSTDVRMAFGYNSEDTYFGLSYVEDESRMKSIDDQVHSRFAIGNVRLNYVKRFKMGPKTQSTINKYLP